MRELLIDSFAGGGGASTGIAAALGREVDVAINHNAEAIAMHAANHPGARHYCENVWKIDPFDATMGERVGLLWASPDCRHFSRAKGQVPVKKEIRGLAWVVVRWAQAVRPRVIVLENVEEFETWGPISAEGRPDPKRKGLTFRRWVNKLRSLGYQVDWRTLVAADYGAPTTRRRLYLVARCDGQPIVWPEPTHGKGRALPWVPASSIIDWTLACPSIHGRAKPLAVKTLARIAEGVRRYVPTSSGAFLTTYYGGEAAGQPLDRPLRTVTSRDRFALVTVKDGEIGMRMLTPAELYRAQGFPAGYEIDAGPLGKQLSKAAQVRMVGNSVCPPVAQALVASNLGARAQGQVLELRRAG